MLRLKQIAQKNLEDAQIAAKLFEEEQKREIAALEDALQRDEAARIERGRRPDLVDREIDFTKASGRTNYTALF